MSQTQILTNTKHISLGTDNCHTFPTTDYSKYQNY